MADIYLNAALGTGTGGDGSIGNPYGDEWAQMLTDNARDLTGTGGDNIYIQGKLSISNTGDANGFNLEGYTQTPTEFVHIQPWPGFEGDGTVAGTPGFAFETGAFARVARWPPQTRITGIAHVNTRTSSNNYYCCETQGNPAPVTFERCIFSSPNRCLELEQQAVVRNCLAIQTTASNDAIRSTRSGGSPPSLDFVTVVSDGAGNNAFNLTNGAVLRNCVAYGTFNNEFPGTYGAGSTNNAGETDPGSLPANIGTNYQQILSDPFEDFLGGDYTPVPGSVLENNGVAIPGITADLIGTPRNDPPEIGALEIGVAGPSITDVSAAAPGATTLPGGSTYTVTNAADGNSWAAVYPNGITPTHADIKGGIGAVGSTANNPITDTGISDGVNTITTPVTGLNASTAYALWVAVEDVATTPASPGSDAFTTTAQTVVVRDTLINVQTGQPIAAGVDVNYWLWNDTDISPGPMGLPIQQGTITTVDPALGYNFNIDVTSVASDGDALAILTHEDVPGGTPPQIDDNWGSGAVVVAIET